MKIRNGFVSNSSSSSFCICGIWISDYNVSFEDTDEDEPCESIPELVEKYGEECGITYSGSEGEYGIGLDISSMKDHETKLEFIQRAERGLRKFYDKAGVKFRNDKIPDARIFHGEYYS